jgi:LPS-assembly lipoprotein
MRRAAFSPRLSALALALALAMLLGGCGFHPVYAPQDGGQAGPALTGLSETSVALIPERSGQILRQALQDRLERGGANGTRLFELVVVSYGVSSEQIGYQQDSNPTRVRLTARASWSLVTLDAQRRTLTSGSARSSDGYNSLDLQYFFGDHASDAAQRRMAEAVADQMMLQLATYFNTTTTSG